jgi:hypothetical protein
VGFLQPLLVLIQLLVYGPAAVFGPRKRHNLDEEMARNQDEERPEKGILHTDRDISTGVTTDVLQDAWFGQHIPLEQHGLSRRTERVRSRRWEVYITLGEKLDNLSSYPKRPVQEK